MFRPNGKIHESVLCLRRNGIVCGIGASCKMKYIGMQKMQRKHILFRLKKCRKLIQAEEVVDLLCSFFFCCFLASFTSNSWQLIASFNIRG